MWGAGDCRARLKITVCSCVSDSAWTGTFLLLRYQDEASDGSDPEAVGHGRGHQLPRTLTFKRLSEQHRRFLGCESEM